MNKRRQDHKQPSAISRRVWRYHHHPRKKRVVCLWSFSWDESLLGNSSPVCYPRTASRCRLLRFGKVGELGCELIHPRWVGSVWMQSGYLLEESSSLVLVVFSQGDSGEV